MWFTGGQMEIWDGYLGPVSIIISPYNGPLNFQITSKVSTDC